MSGLFALVGVGAVLFPFVVNSIREKAATVTLRIKIAGLAWAVAGVVFILFGAMNFFTHIGLIVNTM